MSPNSGGTCAGQLVQITGLNFSSDDSVFFSNASGAARASSVQVASVTQIYARTPDLQPGTYDVVVTNGAGASSPLSAADQFSVSGAPTVTAVQPNAGLPSGGTTVTITGTNLDSPLSVGFGSAAAASFAAVSCSQITAVTPAEPTGTVDVVVTTSTGTTPSSSADQYSFAPAPTISAVSPSDGITLGGTTITVTGSGFTSSSTVAVGPYPATNVVVNSSTSITAATPAEPAGTVDVVVTTPVGSSMTSTADHYTFHGGGVVLDGWGGLHPFGGLSINTSNASYWSGWDVARAVVMLPDGSGGWTLDGLGGVHSFGAAPGIVTPHYTPNSDIARALVVLNDRQSGYLMDGYGNVYPFGPNAPALPGNSVWAWDVAGGLAIHTNTQDVPDGGWTLDDWGGLHPFGAAPSLPAPHYFSGYSYWQRFHVTGDGAGGYQVGRWGIVETTGTVAGIDWSNFSSFGSWDIVRDVVPVGASGPRVPQPEDVTAASALLDTLINNDRRNAGAAALGDNTTMDAISGERYSYNLANCGGATQTISDRTADMLARNYYSFYVAGCSGNVPVWHTYWDAAGITYTYASELLSWSSGADIADGAWNANTSMVNGSASTVDGSLFSALGCGGHVLLSGTWLGIAAPVTVWACGLKG